VKEKNFLHCRNPDSVQIAPVTLQFAGGGETIFFVEVVGREDDITVVVGWSTDPLIEFSFVQGDNTWNVRPSRHARKDVAAALGISNPSDLGFAAASDGGRFR
jgi:hypothetical protein